MIGHLISMGSTVPVPQCRGSLVVSFWVGSSQHTGPASGRHHQLVSHKQFVIEDGLVY